VAALTDGICGRNSQKGPPPLRSGAPGGAWSVQKTKLQDGSPVVAPTH
jgi:hypothetical protein